MKEMFNLYPDTDTARLISMQVARVATDASRSSTRAVGRPRQKLSALGNNKANIAKMHRLLDLIAQERGEVLKQRGVDAGALDEKAKKEELLIVLATYLQVIMREAGPDQGDFKGRVLSAAQEVGGPDMSEVVKHLTN